MSRARATRNALALLQAAGRADIPVARGAARPRTGRFRPSAAFHGPGGLSVRLPEPAQNTSEETAVRFLHGRISAEPGRVAVMALGPLTNLSRLEDRHPGVLSQTAGVVIMGGAVETRGNVTPKAEFNFYSEPLGADHVLGLGTPAMLADLAACRQVGISREQAGALSPRRRSGDWRSECCRAGLSAMSSGRGSSSMIPWRWRSPWIRGLRGFGRLG